jgi:hypothetical protein
MKTISKLLGVLLVGMVSACGGLEYPDYWSTDSTFCWNLFTLPLDLIVTPVIFILKLFPVL